MKEKNIREPCTHLQILRDEKIPSNLFIATYGDLPTKIPGFIWFLIVGDFSKFSWIHLLKYKSEVKMKLKQFSQMVGRKFEKKGLTRLE